MQLRNDVLCEDGFTNRIENGVATGFNVRMRIPYYRGVALSLVDDILVIVDGEHYTGDAIRFQVSGGTFTLDEMTTVVRHRWNYGEKATIQVRKQNGLEPGRHHVEAYASLRINYLPFKDLAGGSADLVMD